MGDSRGKMVQKLAQPFLKWAGGKTQLLDDLLVRIPKKFNEYHEPFLGGGALFFELFNIGRMGEKQGHIFAASLNDINRDLVDAYRSIRSEVEEVIFWLENVYNRYEANFYYEVRERDPATIPDRAERTARLIYLNKTCYNGLYRVNRSGKFNVPFGRYVNPTICNADVLRMASLALQETCLFCEDFGSVVMRNAQEGDFVYFDPPYIPVTEESFTHFTADGFSDTDHAVLAEVARTLKKRGVYVMVSNSDTPFARQLYKDFKIQRVFAKRAINSSGGSRGPVGELIITSYEHGVAETKPRKAAEARASV